MKALGWMYPVVIWGLLSYLAVHSQFGEALIGQASQQLDHADPDSDPVSTNTEGTTLR